MVGAGLWDGASCASGTGQAEAPPILLGFEASNRHDGERGRTLWDFLPLILHFHIILFYYIFLVFHIILF